MHHRAATNHTWSHNNWDYRRAYRDKSNRAVMVTRMAHAATHNEADGEGRQSMAVFVENVGVIISKLTSNGIDLYGRF